MRRPDYDTIAPFYDQLARLVFGDAIAKAQQFLADAVPANSSVLIAGGGTGFIIEQISARISSGLQITYIDSSKKMIALSKRKYKGQNIVTFINQPVQEVGALPMFDVIITPFFFDNFSDKTAANVFQKFHSLLKPGGFWLFSDFQVADKKNLWQRLMLKVMYSFFILVCHIEASALPDTKALFEGNGYTIISSQTFFNRFVYSVVFRKS